jgi:hypothetical protein
MSSKPAVLFQSQAVPVAETAIYPSPAGLLTTITKLSSYNGGAGANTVVVKVVPSGGTAAAPHVMATRTLLAGESYGWPEIVGQHLNPGDFISILPSIAGLNVRGGGTQVTV